MTGEGSRQWDKRDGHHGPVHMDGPGNAARAKLKVPAKSTQRCRHRQPPTPDVGRTKKQTQQTESSPTRGGWYNNIKTNSKYRVTALRLYFHTHKHTTWLLIRAFNLQMILILSRAVTADNYSTWFGMRS